MLLRYTCYELFAAVTHEFGHWKAAKDVGAELQPPFLIPAGLGIIGSFGAITGASDYCAGSDRI